jgi:hypothetical protein
MGHPQKARALRLSPNGDNMRRDVRDPVRASPSLSDIRVSVKPPCHLQPVVERRPDGSVILIRLTKLVSVASIVTQWHPDIPRHSLYTTHTSVCTTEHGDTVWVIAHASDRSASEYRAYVLGRDNRVYAAEGYSRFVAQDKLEQRTAV